MTFVPGPVGVLRPWADAGVFGPFEVHATEAVTRIPLEPGSPAPADGVMLAAALALWAPLHGHVCIDLSDAASIVAATTAEGWDDDDDAARRVVELLPWPGADALSAARWIELVGDSPLVRVVEAHDGPRPDARPFVLHRSRLYTQRQWVDECVVAAALLARAAEGPVPAPRDGEGGDPQVVAARAAAGAAITVIVGGPGTGKTYTVATLLANVLADDAGARIGLAAPTGKAAQRMTVSIRFLASRPEVPAELGALLQSTEALTLHRLLGWRPESRTRFHYDASNVLPYDLVVIDETSMVPLPMMARLLEATGPETRLVLVGDPDQLESVEVGAVLGDIVRADATAASVFRLERQYRTAAESPIGELAALIRQGRADDVVELLRSGTEGVTFVDVEAGRRAGHEKAEAAVRAAVLDDFALARDAARTGDAATALDHIDRQRVLCGHRRGPYGVEEWNRTIHRWVHGPSHERAAGDVLLATRNDPRTATVNGDTGVLVERDGSLAVAFRRGGLTMSWAPAQIAGLEPAYAMTVHKSQGSEYGTVAVIHPPATSPLVGRELLYTAVTRASLHLLVVASADSIRRAVLTPARRVTGLVDALR